MGDFGGPLLSAMDALPTRTKSSALHVENCQFLADTSPNTHLDQPRASDQPSMASSDHKMSLKPIDTPMQHSNANTPAEPATPTSDEPSNPLPEQVTSKDLAAKASSQHSRPATSSSNSSHFKPPTPIRTYREHPRLWVDDGPEAGKATADWRRNYVPILADQTKDMTIEERTRFFDRLCDKDEDRYCQAIATYYTVHPEHLPERELDPRTLKKIEAGFTISPKYDMAQQKCFGDWDNRGPRTRDIVEELGPKNEQTPDDTNLPECEHCIKEARKSRSVIRKVKEKLSSSKHDTTSKPTRRATESSKDRPCNVVVDIPEVSEEQEQYSEHSGSSSGAKPREALTETGVGLTKSVSVKKRRSIAQRLRFSTVHKR